MKILLCGMAFSVVIAAPALAETRYDRALEKAVKGIVAGKIGEIRGGFAYGQMPQFVVLPAAAPIASIPVERPRKEASGGLGDGLSPAVERQVSGTLF